MPVGSPRVHTAVQALFTYQPEPAGEVYAQASGRAQYGYERFLRSVTTGIGGDSRAALAELVAGLNDSGKYA